MTKLYTNWSLYITFTMIITLDKNNFVKVSHHYLISGNLTRLFIANAIWIHCHVLSKM